QKRQEETCAFMTKKHFIQMADYVREHNTHPDRGVHFTDGQIRTLAEFCYAQNPRFNRERWLSYIKGECGPNGGKR
ncbi:MAG: hypothetical protein J2P56_05795, partial [Verrucomicrobia bacterium]|nr:hypothetical protein [Verrucomicrobiota bacterium]